MFVKCIISLILFPSIRLSSSHIFEALDIVDKFVKKKKKKNVIREIEHKSPFQSVYR